MEKLPKFGCESTNGKKWDEAGNSEIVQIILSHSDSGIHSIQFVYVKNDNVSSSQVHGTPSGLKLNTVTLDYPSEFLISVSGENLKNLGVSQLATVSFTTNKHIYGPFGRRSGDVMYCGFNEKFSYEFGSSFGGFHGSVGSSLVDGIGVYVKPVESLSELKGIKSKKT